MNRSTTLVALAGAALGLGRIAAGTAAAQSLTSDHGPAWLDQPITLTVTHGTFVDVLKGFRDSAGVSVVADGVPRRERADVDVRGTVRDALERIADAFDFRWSLTPRGTVLLAKRFTDLEERPQVHLAELRHAAEDCLRALRSLQYDPDERAWTGLLDALAASFTPPQRQALVGGARLRLADLSRGQREVLQNLVVSHALAPARVCWEQLRAALVRWEEGRLVVREARAARGGRVVMLHHEVGPLGPGMVLTNLGTFPADGAKEGQP